jgi:N-acetylneuraminic acid mutarotase
MRTNKKISAYILRGSADALLFSCVIVALCSAIHLPEQPPKALPPQDNAAFGANAQQNRSLSFADRVAYQRAIEDVYWRHRIWPKERPDPKPSLDAVMSQAQLEKRVADYLRKSQALGDYWHRALTAEQLHAEMERMAQQTKQPEMLREIFEALGNDPFVIAECLARPALAERLLTNWYAYDQRIHGDLRQRAEADLRAHNTVEQMKQTSGKQSEIEWLKGDTGQEKKDRGAEHGVKLNSLEWAEQIEKLATVFNKPTAVNASDLGVQRNVTAFESDNMSARSKTADTKADASLPRAKVSPLQEDKSRYYATAVLSKTNDRVKLTTVEWRKEPLDSWLARVGSQVPSDSVRLSANYTLPVISGGSCVDQTWTATPSSPDGRGRHTAVWTGSEMIVWGGANIGLPNLNTGGRYNPATDTWTATNITNAPSSRAGHSAIWTGSEMIVWGGYNYPTLGYLNTGGRYNPSTDSWTETSITNAPAARDSHKAVWTGSQMIVWGGENDSGNLNTGGRYNPSTDSWTPTSTTNAPAARIQPTAVWTDSEMIVWGGYIGIFYFNTGGRYNPSTDSWTATSTTNAPDGRSHHTAVWTGTEMIVWGGYFFEQFTGDHYLNTGGRYNPSTNSWTATSINNAPSARSGHTAVGGTDNEMIVWGGGDATSTFNTGGRYNPGTDSWTATSINNAPSARSGHTAVWTDNEMIVWGGYPLLNTGGRYNPGTDTWTNTGTNLPEARDFHTAVWTGNEMIVWGGNHLFGAINTGGRYDPGTDSWTLTSTVNAPDPRLDHTAVWTGNEMIVWGGSPDGHTFFNSGGRYDPGTDSWTATTTNDAPTGRVSHTAVWSGSEMIVWGGEIPGSPEWNTGGRYNPITDSWTATSITNAPVGRHEHTAVWTGSEMIVWGGLSNPGGLSNTGGRYNPSTDSWTATSTTNAPDARTGHRAVWTDSEMVVWGGAAIGLLNTGGRYNPITDGWTATTTNDAPTGRHLHTAAWTGSEMIVWGGESATPFVNTGGRYNPSTDSWTATSTTNAPTGRVGHTAVWTGSEMIVWGGYDGVSSNTGGRYCAQAGPTPTPTATATVTATPSATPTATVRPTPTPRLAPTPRPRPTPAPRP